MRPGHTIDTIDVDRIQPRFDIRSTFSVVPKETRSIEALEAVWRFLRSVTQTFLRAGSVIADISGVKLYSDIRVVPARSKTVGLFARKSGEMRAANSTRHSKH